MKAWPILGFVTVQTILCLIHWFLYLTCIAFFHPSAGTTAILRIVLGVLSLVFMASSLLAYRFSNRAVDFFYRVAMVWMALLNFLFFGACAAWLMDLVLRVAMPAPLRMEARPEMAEALITVALALTLYGFFNARRIRLREITVELDRLPPQWRGRKAFVASDLHLGHINRGRFAARIARLAEGFDPDVVFLPGDLFDGTHVDAAEVAAPLLALRPRFGVFFVAGNHEEFGNPSHYTSPLKVGGFRVLENEREIIDGLEVVGVNYQSSMQPMSHRQFLNSLNLRESPASILLQHVPSRLPIAEQAGVSLMLCGHTHGGQFVPFSWLTRRVFGKYTHGLERFGAMQVLTSSGAGTWGPPMRVGTAPEVVVITFQ